MEPRGEKVDLVGVVQPSGAPREIRVCFTYPRRFESFLLPAADPFVPILLLPAMAAYEPLEIIPPVSRRLLHSLPRIQWMLSLWFREFTRVEVIASDGETASSAGRGGARAPAGAFFSGGVDSFYTLLRNVREPDPGDPAITHLVFLDGYENPLETMRAHPSTLRMVHEVAEAFGKEAIVGETNVRSHFPLSWGTHYHGAVLAGAALTLSRRCETFYIPASFSYPYLRPWGSHPLLDPLWSTERQTILHDGNEARRVDKIVRFLADDPVALRHLRVCLDSRGRGGNCGRCRKCLRTMATFAILGKLESATAFPSTFPDDFERRWPSRILQKNASSIEAEVRNARNNLELAQSVANPDSRMVQYLETLVRLGERRLFRIDLSQRVRGLFQKRDYGGIRNDMRFG